MRVKLTPAEIDKGMFYVPSQTEWATVKQIAEWMNVDHLPNANRIGARLGRANFPNTDISYKGSKTRAWYFGHSAPVASWTPERVRAELDSNELDLSKLRLLRLVVRAA